MNDKRSFVVSFKIAGKEDLPDISFSGQQDTYLNVKGCKRCYQKD